MSMTFSGSGTITGLVAGGLPDAVVTSSDLAANAVDSQSLTLFNASGSAPVYACRAFVNFNGTGTVAIRAAGNVTSITDNATGDYTVNFSTAMPDINYAPVGSQTSTSGGTTVSFNMNTAGTIVSPTTSAFRFITNTTIGVADSQYVNVAVFR